MKTKKQIKAQSQRKNAYLLKCCLIRSIKANYVGKMEV